MDGAIEICILSLRSFKYQIFFIVKRHHWIYHEAKTNYSWIIQFFKRFNLKTPLLIISDSDSTIDIEFAEFEFFNPLIQKSIWNSPNRSDQDNIEEILAYLGEKDMNYSENLSHKKTWFFKYLKCRKNFFTTSRKFIQRL